MHMYCQLHFFLLLARNYQIISHLLHVFTAHDDANAVACYYYLRLDISMLMRSALLILSTLLVLVLNPRVLDIVVRRLKIF